MTDPTPIRYPRDIPPMWLLATLAGIWALDRWLPIARWLSPPWTWSGLVLVVVGVGLAVWGAGLFRRAGTGVRPFTEATEMVRNGPYRFTRNPMYLGMLLLTSGVAVTLGSVAPLLLLPLFAAVLHIRFIRREEEFLTRRFGADYLAWCKTVRRWL
ncbi:MAG: isoprenylcysteine carboxylmethyltransferase family protein [Planctomycetes bacterium]|nr:isoprenylcysteine carboxylmethyltransferase family protein [Planctomycetota bacterium]